LLVPVWPALRCISKFEDFDARSSASAGSDPGYAI
jgi:hypothetical protein